MVLNEILEKIVIVKTKTNYSISHIEISEDKYDELLKEINFLGTTNLDFFQKELLQFFITPRVYDEAEANRIKDIGLGELKSNQYIKVTNENDVDIVVIVNKRSDV
jgi:aspartate/glutamate racemase